jgi:hypothetical protein
MDQITLKLAKQELDKEKRLKFEHKKKVEL